MAKQLKVKDEENINFEDSMKQLDEIASELESGKLNLEDSIKLFEEGMELSRKCNDFLEEAEKKITILLNEDGEIKEENFTTEE